MWFTQPGVHACQRIYAPRQNKRLVRAESAFGPREQKTFSACCTLGRQMAATARQCQTPQNATNMTDTKSSKCSQQRFLASSVLSSDMSLVVSSPDADTGLRATWSTHCSVESS